MQQTVNIIHNIKNLLCLTVSYSVGYDGNCDTSPAGTKFMNVYSSFNSNESTTSLIRRESLSNEYTTESTTHNNSTPRSDSIHSPYTTVSYELRIILCKMI